MTGSWGAPFQQLHSLPHFHPSLRPEECMKSPRCHKSRRERPSLLSSRQQAAKQGISLASRNRRLPEVLQWALSLASGPAPPGLLTPAATSASEARGLSEGLRTLPLGKGLAAGSQPNCSCQGLTFTGSWACGLGGDGWSSRIRCLLAPNPPIPDSVTWTYD